MNHVMAKSKAIKMYNAMMAKNPDLPHEYILACCLREYPMLGRRSIEDYLRTQEEGQKALDMFQEKTGGSE